MTNEINKRLDEIQAQLDEAAISKEGKTPEPPKTQKLNLPKLLVFREGGRRAEIVKTKYLDPSTKPPMACPTFLPRLPDGDDYLCQAQSWLDESEIQGGG